MALKEDSRLEGIHVLSLKYASLFMHGRSLSFQYRSRMRNSSLSGLSDYEATYSDSIRVSLSGKSSG